MCKRYFVALLLVALTAQTWAEGDADAGKIKAVACAACHGADGNSVMPEWPKLAGQHGSYIALQLKLFKTGARSNPIMLGMSAALSEQDMSDLGAFYATQTISPASANETQVELGQKVFRGGNSETGVPACMACHGPAGKGNGPAGYPALAGQHGQYIEAQLTAYRNGTGHGSDQTMIDVTRALSLEEIKAVSSYIQGLH